MERDPLSVREPRPGVQQWKNPGNGLAVLQLHYTADPRKRTAEWQEKTFRSLSPRARKREYEIDWASPEGEPVIPEYSPALHRRVGIPVDPTLRLLRFWDFGFDSPVVLFAQLSLTNQLRILRELCPFNTSLVMLVPMVRALTLQLLGSYGLPEDGMDVGGSDDMLQLWGLERSPTTQAFDAGDPAGHARGSLGTEIEILGQLGIQVHTIRPGTEESYQALRGRFQKTIFTQDKGHEPAILLDARCTNLHAALAGAFCRSTHAPYKPVKSHPHKDLVDALRYGNDNLDEASGQHDRRMREMAANDLKDLRA